MINIEDKALCCGCSSCVQRCPKSCISLQEDSEGFLYPVIEKDKCVGCNICEAVCPVINPSPSRTPLYAYAAINTNEEIRSESSSGGIFSALAENVIDKGGVVFGAVFDSDWSVKHDLVRNKADIYKLRGSKYVQSNIQSSYLQAEEYLKKDVYVLFSGTPCQIAGLKSFLRKDYKNLLTVDFICHGVPSPGVWKWNLQCKKAAFEAARGESSVLDSSLNIPSLIKDVRFRDKSEGWRKYRFVLVFAEASAEGKKSTVLSSSTSKEGYMVAFLNDICLRPSCYSCPSKSGKSGSDITIADFWGISQFETELDDDMGTSLVLVNTGKGKNYLDEISVYRHEVCVKKAIETNISWEKSAYRHELHDYFFKTYKLHVNDFSHFVDDLVCTKSFIKKVIRKIFRLIGYRQLPV